MTLRTKLSLVIIIDIVATLLIAGFLIISESRQVIQTLARELLQGRSQYAFLQCQNYFDTNGGEPAEALIDAIQGVSIADEGYMFVFSNDARPEHRGTLIIHPTDAGNYIGNFPHIKQVLEEIDGGGNEHGQSGFITYRQGTEARGRQGAIKIGHYIYFAPWGWVIMSSGYEDDLHGQADAVFERVTAGVIVLGVLSLLIANFFVIRMFRPMQELIGATKKVASGDMNVTIPVKRKDEIGRLAGHFNHMLANLRENMRVWQELEIARRLQSDMLPEREPDLPGVTIEAKSIPATEVGGDFYDFIPLDENRFALIIGDVSGKGVSGAIGMSSSLSALRFAADERDSTDKILELANKRLVRDIQRYMFVAVFLAIYDRREKKLFYTNAGQTMPILLRGGKAEFLPQSEADRFPLGIRPEVDYAEQAFDVQNGDLLVCYTDGIVELSDESGEMYGFEHFKNSIEKHGDLAMLDQLNNLVEDAETFTKNAAHIDDITIVLAKFS